MVTVAYMIAVVLLVVALVAFAILQLIGEHADNVEDRRRHNRRLV